MSLDRQLQHRLLEAMRERYPASAHGVSLLDVLSGDASNRAERAQTVAANLAYLKEHGLAEVTIHISNDGSGSASFGAAKITARGLDFLADDGGLSAILGVVTVRLHADTLRELLAQRVQADKELPPERKAGLLQAIKHLPETALQEATKQLVRAGLDHWPSAMHWLQTLSGS